MYWLDSKGALSFTAISTDGDSSVDLAFYLYPGTSTIEYFARCDWSQWLTLAQWIQIHEQAGVSSAQAGSLAYLEEVTPTNDDLSSLGLEVYTPSIGVSVCATDSSEECDVEPED